MTDQVPGPGAGGPIDPISDAEMMGILGRVPAPPAVHAPTGAMGCLMLLLSIGGLFIGPLALAALTAAFAACITAANERIRVPVLAAAAGAIGVLGECLWVVHWPSLVNWTNWL